MRAIILAAGSNSRISGYIDVPKCLLLFGGSTILENQINALIKAGLTREEIIVVVGHKYEMIEKVHKNTLFNSKFREFNNGYSVYLALQHLIHEHNLKDNEQILILDGDIVCEDELLSKVVSLDKENILVNRSIKYSTELKDEISIVDGNGKVSELIIPSKEKPLDSRHSEKPLYSFIGIMKISKNVAIQLYEKLKNSYQGWYTIPLPELVSLNDFHSLEVPHDLKYCFDVDTKEDIEKLSAIK